MIDNKFLQNYSQLNKKKKKVINQLANDLIKLQLEESIRKKQNKS